MKIRPAAHPATSSVRPSRAAGAKATRTPVMRTSRAGRPRVSGLPRSEQLRQAKRAQRERERAAGLVQAQLRLPAPLAARLMFAAQQPAFTATLSEFLDSALVEAARYPQLKLLCWNRRSPWLSAADAWSLYERNWRFIESERLEPAERQLIDRLNARFGAGVPHG